MSNTKSTRVYRKAVLMLDKIKLGGSGEAPLYLRITIDRKRKHIALGKYIHPDFWDKRAARLKGVGQCS